MNILLLYWIQYTVCGLVTGVPLEGKHYHGGSMIQDPLTEVPINAGHQNSNKHNIIFPNKNNSSNTTLNSVKGQNEIDIRFFQENKVYESYRAMTNGKIKQNDNANGVRLPSAEIPAYPTILKRIQIPDNDSSRQANTEVTNIGNNNKSETYTDKELKEQINDIFDNDSLRQANTEVINIGNNNKDEAYTDKELKELINDIFDNDSLRQANTEVINTGSDNKGEAYTDKELKELINDIFDNHSSRQANTEVINIGSNNKSEAYTDKELKEQINDIFDNDSSRQANTEVIKIGSNNNSEAYTDKEVKELINDIFGDLELGTNSDDLSTKISVPNDEHKELNDSDVRGYPEDHNVKTSTDTTIETLKDAYMPVDVIIAKIEDLKNNYITRRNQNLINASNVNLETNYVYHKPRSLYVLTNISSSENSSEFKGLSSSSENASTFVTTVEIPQMLRKSRTMRSDPLLNNTLTNNTSKTFKPDIILYLLIFFVFYNNVFIT